jgi:hypothetical protein
MKMNKHMEKAIEIRNGSAGFLNELNRESKSLITKAKTDLLLSAEGRRQKSKQIREEKAVELLKKIHHRKNQYIGHLKKAQQAAKDVLKKPIEKPSDEEIQAFQRALKDLKTTITLSTNPKTSEAKLKTFVSEIKDPYIASLLREEFTSVVGDIISSAGGEAQQYKMRLFDLYEGLEKDFLSDEHREAQSIVQFSESEIANNRLFMGFAPDGMPSLHMAAVIEVFGNDYAKWIDKTDAFFEKNAEIELLPDGEVSDFDDETGEEKLSNDQILEAAYKKSITGSTEDKIRFAMLKQELEAK